MASNPPSPPSPFVPVTTVPGSGQGQGLTPFVPAPIRPVTPSLVPVKPNQIKPITGLKPVVSPTKRTTAPKIKGPSDKFQEYWKEGLKSRAPSIIVARGALEAEMGGRMISNAIPGIATFFGGLGADIKGLVYNKLIRDEEYDANTMQELWHSIGRTAGLVYDAKPGRGWGARWGDYWDALESGTPLSQFLIEDIGNITIAGGLVSQGLKRGAQMSALGSNIATTRAMNAGRVSTMGPKLYSVSETMGTAGRAVSKAMAPFNKAAMLPIKPWVMGAGALGKMIRRGAYLGNGYLAWGEKAAAAYRQRAASVFDRFKDMDSTNPEYETLRSEYFDLTKKAARGERFAYGWGLRRKAAAVARSAKAEYGRAARAVQKQVDKPLHLNEVDPETGVTYGPLDATEQAAVLAVLDGHAQLLNELSKEFGIPLEKLTLLSRYDAAPGRYVTPEAAAMAAQFLDNGAGMSRMQYDRLATAAKAVATEIGSQTNAKIVGAGRVNPLNPHHLVPVPVASYLRDRLARAGLIDLVDLIDSAADILELPIDDPRRMAFLQSIVDVLPEEIALDPMIYPSPMRPIVEAYRRIRRNLERGAIEEGTGTFPRDPKSGRPGAARRTAGKFRETAEKAKERFDRISERIARLEEKHSASIEQLRRMDLVEKHVTEALTPEQLAAEFNMRVEDVNTILSNSRLVQAHRRMRRLYENYLKIQERASLLGVDDTTNRQALVDEMTMLEEQVALIKQAYDAEVARLQQERAAIDESMNVVEDEMDNLDNDLFDAEDDYVEAGGNPEDLNVPDETLKELGIGDEQGIRAVAESIASDETILAELEAMVEQKIYLEEQINKMENPTQEEIQAAQTDRVNSAVVAIDELNTEAEQFLGGGYNSGESGIKFYVTPLPENSMWEWWYRLDPKIRRRWAMQYFRGSKYMRTLGTRGSKTSKMKLPGAGLDQMAEPLGLTPEEWGDKFIDWASRMDEAKRELRDSRAEDMTREEVVALDQDLAQAYNELYDLVKEQGLDDYTIAAIEMARQMVDGTYRPPAPSEPGLVAPTPAEPPTPRLEAPTTAVRKPKDIINVVRASAGPTITATYEDGNYIIVSGEPPTPGRNPNRIEMKVYTSFGYVDKEFKPYFENNDLVIRAIDLVLSEIEQSVKRVGPKSKDYEYLHVDFADVVDEAEFTPELREQSRKWVPSSTPKIIYTVVMNTGGFKKSNISVSEFVDALTTLRDQLSGESTPLPTPVSPPEPTPAPRLAAPADPRRQQLEQQLREAEAVAEGIVSRSYEDYLTRSNAEFQAGLIKAEIEKLDQPISEQDVVRFREEFGGVPTTDGKRVNDQWYTRSEMMAEGATAGYRNPQNTVKGDTEPDRMRSYRLRRFAIGNPKVGLFLYIDRSPKGFVAGASPAMLIAVPPTWQQFRDQINTVIEQKQGQEDYHARVDGVNDSFVGGTNESNKVLPNLNRLLKYIDKKIAAGETTIYTPKELPTRIRPSDEIEQFLDPHTGWELYYAAEDLASGDTSLFGDLVQTKRDMLEVHGTLQAVKLSLENPEQYPMPDDIPEEYLGLGIREIDELINEAANEISSLEGEIQAELVSYEAERGRLAPVETPATSGPAKIVDGVLSGGTKSATNTAELFAPGGRADEISKAVVESIDPKKFKNKYQKKTTTVFYGQYPPNVEPRIYTTVIVDNKTKQIQPRFIIRGSAGDAHPAVRDEFPEIEIYSRDNYTLDEIVAEIELLRSVFDAYATLPLEKISDGNRSSDYIDESIVDVMGYNPFPEFKVLQGWQVIDSMPFVFDGEGESYTPRLMNPREFEQFHIGLDRMREAVEAVYNSKSSIPSGRAGSGRLAPTRVPPVPDPTIANPEVQRAVYENEVTRYLLKTEMEAYEAAQTVKEKLKALDDLLIAAAKNKAAYEAFINQFNRFRQGRANLLAIPAKISAERAKLEPLQEEIDKNNAVANRIINSEQMRLLNAMPANYPLSIAMNLGDQYPTSLIPIEMPDGSTVRPMGPGYVPGGTRERSYGGGALGSYVDVEGMTGFRKPSSEKMRVGDRQNIFNMAELAMRMAEEGESVVQNSSWKILVSQYGQKAADVLGDDVVASLKDQASREAENLNFEDHYAMVGEIPPEDFIAGVGAGAPGTKNPAWLLEAAKARLFGEKLADYMKARGLGPVDPYRTPGTRFKGYEIGEETMFVPDYVVENVSQIEARLDPENLGWMMRKATAINKIWKGSTLAFSIMWQIGDLTTAMIIARMTGIPFKVMIERMKQVASEEYATRRSLYDPNVEVGSGPYTEVAFSSPVQDVSVSTAERAFLRNLPPLIGKKTLLQRMGRVGRPIETFAQRSFKLNETINRITRHAFFLEKLDRVLAELGTDLDTVVADGSWKTNSAIREVVNDAAISANKWLGDFADLSARERRYVSLVFPFYAWTKHIHKVFYALGKEHPQSLTFYMYMGTLGADTEEDPLDLRLGTLAIFGGAASVNWLNPLADVVEGPIGSLLLKGDPRKIGSMTGPVVRIPAAGLGIDMARLDRLSRPAGTGMYTKTGMPQPGLFNPSDPSTYSPVLGYGIQQFPIANRLLNLGPVGGEIPGTNIATGPVLRYATGEARTIPGTDKPRVQPGGRIAAVGRLFSVPGIPSRSDEQLADVYRSAKIRLKSLETLKKRNERDD